MPTSADGTDVTDPPPVPEPRKDPFLVCDSITSGYRRVPVVKDVSLQVAFGEVVLVIGPNGAGKSTLVKSVTGQVSLLGGAVYLGGDDVSRMKEDVRAARGIGYVPQVNDVFPTLTVTENLEMGGYRVPKSELKARIESIFETFPTLAALRRRQARTLSGGERKTLGIARALVPEPLLLILDEPTANLSPIVASRVLHEVVETLASMGRAVLAIEQRVSLGLDVATWGYVLAEGQVRLEASASDLRDHPDLASLFLSGRRPSAAREAS